MMCCPSSVGSKGRSTVTMMSTVSGYFIIVALHRGGGALSVWKMSVSSQKVLFTLVSITPSHLPM